MSGRSKVAGIAAAAAVVYIGAIVMANWLIVHVGFIEVFPVPGRGGGMKLPPESHPRWVLYAPAGVYMAGLSFPVRDVLQRAVQGVAGRRAGYAAGAAAIMVAAGVTYLISPQLAFASGVTFLASESLDMSVYSVLQRRWFTAGVVVSSVAAAVFDSWLFLTLAKIPLSVAFAGQVAGKLEVVFLVGIPVALALRRALPLTARRVPVEVLAA